MVVIGRLEDGVSARLCEGPHQRSTSHNLSVERKPGDDSRPIPVLLHIIFEIPVGEGLRDRRLLEPWEGLGVALRFRNDFLTFRTPILQ
jgi:hypothetical protein